MPAATLAIRYLSLFESSSLEAELRAHVKELRAYAAELAAEYGLDQDTQPSPKEEELISAALLSAPGITMLAGRLTAALGTRLDKEQITAVGKAIEHYGHKIHEGVITLISFVIKPLIFWLPEKKQHAVSTAVFIAILAYKIISSFGAEGIHHLIHPDGETVIHQALNSVKANEIREMFRDLAPLLARSA